MRDEVMTLDGTEFTERGFSVRSIKSLSTVEKIRLIAEYREKIKKLVRSDKEEKAVWDNIEEDSASTYKEIKKASEVRDKRKENELELNDSHDPKEHDYVNRMKILLAKSKWMKETVQI